MHENTHEKHTDHTLHQLLKIHFGFDRFRTPQLDVIRSIVAGQDTFALLPTGAGKSLCYQLPALAFPGVTIVISPLIALMKDQVDHLTAKGIAAACVNSTMSRSELREIAQRVNRGEMKLLYVSPERLAVVRFREWLSKKNVSLIAIDEAHCISEWGHDFRPEYRQLRHLRELFPGVPMIALTATAIPQARDNIIESLQLRSPQVFQTSFNRANLHYIIRSEVDRWEEMLAWLRKYQGESVVIYCISRKSTELVAADLTQAGFRAVPYHAGLAKEKRAEIQDQFLAGKVEIVVATIAFGMGVDKSDIRLVIHFDLPKSLEGYYQETGRAGRDGGLSHCVLLFDEASLSVHERLLAKIADRKVRSLSEKKFQLMVQYCRSRVCRRKFVLEYFAEKFTTRNCGSCDRCLPAYREASQLHPAQEPLQFHAEVFRKLKQLRFRLAARQNVPAFVVFSDQALLEMATYLPTSVEAFANISGVGAHKLQRYGRLFTALIGELCQRFELHSIEKPPKGRVERMARVIAQ